MLGVSWQCDRQCRAKLTLGFDRVAVRDTPYERPLPHGSGLFAYCRVARLSRAYGYAIPSAAQSDNAIGINVGYRS